MPAIKDLITANVCGNTIFENSWIWYCDECRKHGTATSSREVVFMASAHSEYFQWEDIPPTDEESEEEVELLSYMDATYEQRQNLNWTGGCIEEGCVYIIDEGSNITYRFGEDYEDKTPNDVGDIVVAQHLRQQLGID